MNRDNRTPIKETRAKFPGQLRITNIVIRHGRYNPRTRVEFRRSRFSNENGKQFCGGERQYTPDNMFLYQLLETLREQDTDGCVELIPEFLESTDQHEVVVELVIWPWK